MYFLYFLYIRAILIKVYGLVRIHDMLHLQEYLQLSDNFAHARAGIINELRRNERGDLSEK